jgi:hypothetical protein
MVVVSDGNPKISKFKSMTTDASQEVEEEVILAMLSKVNRKLNRSLCRIHALHESLNDFHRREVKYLEYKMTLAKTSQSLSEIGFLITQGACSVGGMVVGAAALFLLGAVCFGYMRFIATLFLMAVRHLETDNSFLFLLKNFSKALTTAYPANWHSDSNRNETYFSQTNEL